MSFAGDDRTSLWLDRPRAVIDEPLPDDESFDDIVVGAGLTGLVSALLLARAGRYVGVIEARHVGAVTTGHSTAKVTLLQGTKLSRMLRLNSRSVVEAYVEANREGRDWLLRFCADHEVAFQTRDAVTFASTADEISAARDEHDAALGLGLPVQWTSDLPVPFPLVGAAVLPDQAQLDPMELLDALVAQLRSHGGTLHEGHRVVQVSGTGRPEVTLADGRTLRADNVVLATGVPTLDRGLYFAKVEPRRSYALAFESATPPDAMLLSAGDPVVSVRGALGVASPRLLVGGHGHVVGRTRSEAQHVEALRDWVATYYPEARETHGWSAQDYSSADDIPFVGQMPRGHGHLYLATGFDKWGLTNAVAAARGITGEILGAEPGWSRTLGDRSTRPRAAAGVARINLGVAAAMLRSAPRVPRTLTRTDDVLPVCTHLGGCLHWNDAESTWDCPLHGSRFTRDGQVLEGPASRPLRSRRK